MNGLFTNAQNAMLEAAMDYVLKDPAGRLPRLVDALEKLDLRGEHAHQIAAVRPLAADPESNWNQFVVKLCREIDHDVLKATVRNFLLNAGILGIQKQEESRKKYDCNIPWAILMDPTSACNLRCTGCWAAEYGDKLNMSYEELDSIIRQANALGTYFFLYSGGEPLVRKTDIIRLCEAHPDCQFTAFTNGTLIDEPFAKDMLRVKNFIPAISVEGFESDTDFRRGAGPLPGWNGPWRCSRQKSCPSGSPAAIPAKMWNRSAARRILTR